MIATMPNLRPAVGLREAHVLDLPPMCPRSGNPRPGSYVVIRYVPAASFLEVYSLKKYVQQFVGGWLRDGQHIRDMEQVIQTMAEDCAAALGVPVSIRARLVLDAGGMVLRGRAEL